MANDNSRTFSSSIVFYPARFRETLGYKVVCSDPVDYNIVTEQSRSTLFFSRVVLDTSSIFNALGLPVPRAIIILFFSTTNTPCFIFHYFRLCREIILSWLPAQTFHTGNSSHRSPSRDFVIFFDPRNSKLFTNARTDFRFRYYLPTWNQNKNKLWWLRKILTAPFFFLLHSHFDV